ncbi:MAG: hypothetical protein ACLP4R_09975 [Solirubrobacteraceae bacterium]
MAAPDTPTAVAMDELAGRALIARRRGRRGRVARDRETRLAQLQLYEYRR